MNTQGTAHLSRASSSRTSPFQVSQHLKEVSHRRDVWTEAYFRASLVRPPGPFLSQSARDLESALVSSFRVDRNLRHGGRTTQSEHLTLKLRAIRYTGTALHVGLVFGRFLLIALPEEARCYDLDLDQLDTNLGSHNL